MSNKFKNAVYGLLDSLTDTVDLEANDDEEYFIDAIVEVLIQRNGDTCPYKNYGSEVHCQNRDNCGRDRFDIDCNKEKEEVWNDFLEG